MAYPYYPYQPNYFQPQLPQIPTAMQPKMEVVRVNGRNGAEAFAIGANSSALLLDESGTMIWLVTTDGAGYKTVSAYDITPHQQTPSPDYSTLESRITKLEERLNGYSDDSATTRTKRVKSTDSAD